MKPDALHASPTLAKEVLLVTIVLDNVDSVLFAVIILVPRNVISTARKVLPHWADNFPNLNLSYG